MTVVATNGEPVRLQVARLTASMFDVLRVRPMRGRAFVPDDEPSSRNGQMPPHVSQLRTVVRERDAAVALDSMMTMEERVTTSLAKPRLYAVLLTGFAIAASVLAIAGVGPFGVVSYTVPQRQREIGVRTALGTQVGDIVALLLRYALAIVLVGVTAGIWIAYALPRYISSFLYAVGVVVAMTSLVPGRRAARIDPLIGLRTE